MLSIRLIASAVILAAIALFLSGCATADDPDNLSERPWNAPKTWETSLPTQMLEER